MKIDQEGKMTIKHLCSKGVSNRQVARLLCVSEGVVRYHRGREHSGAIDGRSRQPPNTMAALTGSSTSCWSANFSGVRNVGFAHR
jgi:hypothetical protein